MAKKAKAKKGTKPLQSSSLFDKLERSLRILLGTQEKKVRRKTPAPPLTRIDILARPRSITPKFIKPPEKVINLVPQAALDYQISPRISALAEPNIRAPRTEGYIYFGRNKFRLSSWNATLKPTTTNGTMTTDSAKSIKCSSPITSKSPAYTQRATVKCTPIVVA